jgi:hypothetical protein
VVAVGMLALVVYYVATPGVFQGKASGDGWFGFHYLRALVFKHTLDMQEVLPKFLPYFGTTGPAHHMPNRCPFGPVLVWMPFYLVACALQGLGALVHLASPVNGDEPFVAGVTGLGTLAGVLVGWRYTYLLVERHAGRTAARVGSTAAVWATPIAWYAVTQPFYQHGLAFATTAILVERWDATRGQPSWRRMLGLGLVGGLGMSMREQEALWLLLPGLEAAWWVLRGPERARWLVGGVVLTAATLLAFVPQLVVWRYYTGSLLHPPQVEPLRWSTPFVVVALFSTRGGLFPWSPIAYAALVGVLWARRARGLAWALVAVFAIEVYVVASAWVVTGGYGYGARRLSDGAVWMALGVGLLWDRVADGRWGRRAVAAFTALCLVLNVWAMELLRHMKIGSSGGYARSAERFLQDAHAPSLLVRLLGATGYPFVQPFGWLFSWRWHAPATAFENLVGAWFLDRDGQWFQVQSRTLMLDASPANASFVLGGLALAPKPPARVLGPVRLLLPMFAAEPLAVHFTGTIPAGARGARWNGVSIPCRDDPTGLRLDIPGSAVRAGTNELLLFLPLGSQLMRLDLDSTSTWWKEMGQHH